MAAIPTTMGNAGQGLGDAAGLPKLSEALRDIADDLSNGKAATIAGADAVAAAGANPTKAEYDVVVTLVNELKAALNAVQSTALLTTKA